MKELDLLFKVLPKDGIIDWDYIYKTVLRTFYLDMEKTNQEHKWHQEGNVLIHTKMVVNEIIKFDEYNCLSEIEKLELFLAALLHDIGKTVCTKVIDGEIRSFNHGIIGSHMARSLLWKEYGLSGNELYQNIRETICLLIKYHSSPIYSGRDEDTKKIIKMSLNQKLASHFNLKMLSILSKADLLGRIGEKVNEQLENVERFNTIANNLNCFTKPFEFRNEYTKVQYFEKKYIWHEEELFDSTYGEVILICGLPGTGKDTYIKKMYHDLDIVSLDDLRVEYDVDPNDDQGYIYNVAKEKAKEYLRNKKTFIWNATNISELTRKKQIRLFHDYHARVRVIFLETSWKENIKRNKARKNEVMEKVIVKLLDKLNLPEDYEAEYIEWICV